MSELASAFDQALEDLLPVADTLARAESDAFLHRAVRSEIMDMGWNGLATPEESGGLGLAVSEIMELCAVAGRHLLPVSLLDESLVLAPALAGGESSLLEAVVGSVSGGAGYVAEGAGAVDTGGRVSVSGVGVRLSPGATLAALVHPRWTAVVPLDDPGVSLQGTSALDRGQGVHLLTIEEVRPLVMVAGWEDGGAVAARWLGGLLADLAGGADRMLSMSVSHARQRHQFGRPLFRFQAVSHRLAEMKARLELMRSALARLASHLDRGIGDGAFLAGLLWAIPTYAREVCESAIQVHGGMGFTWEYGLHLYYRRILACQAMLGGGLDSAAQAGHTYLKTLSV